MSPVIPCMTRVRVRAGVLLGAALLAAGCAAQPGGVSAGTAPSSTPADGDVPLPDTGLVLQVAYVGGFVPPQVTYAQLPLVSMYADGQVITEGPVIAIYPGPALPNLQTTRIEPSRVAELAQHALEAGVGEEFDYGMPPVADVPSTRFTVVTDDGTETTEVYALQRGLFPQDEQVPGLTDEQVAARSELQGLVDELTGVGGAATESYVPEAVAAVVTPEADRDDGAPAREPVAWPGPPLPGDPLAGELDLSCVTATGTDADAVLDAAADANAETPWTMDDGTTWSLTLRPLLPHESDCADLPTP